MALCVTEGKVEAVSLGAGMCRGPVWQRGVWPIAKGFKSKKACAEACAKTKNCMGFDLSDESDKGPSIYDVRKNWIF